MENALSFIERIFKPLTEVTIADEYGDIIYNGTVRGLHAWSVDEVYGVLMDSTVTSVELGNGKDEDIIIEIETKTKKTTGFYH